MKTSANPQRCEQESGSFRKLPPAMRAYQPCLRPQRPLASKSSRTPTRRVVCLAVAKDYSKAGAFETHTRDIQNTNLSLLKGLCSTGKHPAPLFASMPKLVLEQLGGAYKLITITEPVDRDSAPGSGSTNEFALIAVPKGQAVLLISGFEAREECYLDYANHMASWGYTVIQPNLGGFLEDARVTDRAIVTTLAGILAKLKEDNSLPSVDWGLGTGIAGHSRGGKLAALLYGYGRPNVDETTVALPELGQLTTAELKTIKDLDIRTAFFLDPVNNKSPTTAFTKENPSAIELWKMLRTSLNEPVDVGIIGAGLSIYLPFYGDILRPTGNTYQQFLDEDNDSGSWDLLFPRAAHLDFCQDVWFGFWLWIRTGHGLHGGLITLAGYLMKGILFVTFQQPEGTQEVIDTSKACMLAWLEKTFNTSNYNAQWYPKWKAYYQAKGLVKDCPHLLQSKH